MRRMSRKIATLSLVLAVSFAAAAQTAPRKKRIAIMDFDYATVHEGVSQIFGQDVDIGKGITAMLENDLVKDGTYSIIERGAMDKILAEQNFSNSDRADPNTAAKIGKLLGVDAIVVGSITQFGDDTKSLGTGGIGANRGGILGGGFGHKKTKCTVGITARAIDINTAEILAVAEGKGESSRGSFSTGGGGGLWGRGGGGGKVDMGSSDFQNTIIGEATKASVDQLSVNFVADKDKLVVAVRTVIVTGLVASVDGGQIVLNVGGKAGVHVGDQLNVERLTKEIKDPQSGQVIRRLTSPVGVIKVTDVDDVSSVCSVVSGAGFKIGDSVKTSMQQ